MTTPARSFSAIEPQTAATAETSRYFALLLSGGEKLLDAGAVAFALCAAEIIDRRLDLDSGPAYPFATVALAASGFGLLFVLLFERHGGYQPCVSLLAIRETERILRVTLQSFGVALLTAYVFSLPMVRVGSALAIAVVPLFLTFEKWQTRKLLRVLRGHGARRALILGTGSAARRIYTALLNSPKFGVEPVAFIDDCDTRAGEIFECSYHREHSARVLAGPLSPELLRQTGASIVIVSDASMDREAMQSVIAIASAAGATAQFATRDFVEPGYWLDYTEIDDIVLAHVSPPPSRMLGDIAKRLSDILIAALVLLLLAPVWLTIALLVRQSSPGQALFRQQRVGKDGRLFSIYKFRTMYCDAPQYEYSPTAGGDARVTPIGRLLRRTSLDEIPQLLNVLLGDMSLVGPRPEMPFIVEQYTQLQRLRLSVKPGMTGLWQISADRAFLIHENIEYDLYYVRHRSVFLDIAVLLHTCLFVARGI